MQILEQAIQNTGSLDDETLAGFARSAAFDTVVGPVRFGEGGGWAEPRVLQVQYRGITRADAGAFKEPDTQVVVAPNELASGTLTYPASESPQSDASLAVAELR